MIVDDEPSWLRRLFTWLVRGDRHAERPPPTRDELVAARERTRRQLDILAAGPNYGRAGPSQTPMLMAELQAEIDGLDEEIARLDRFNPPSERPPPSPPSG